MSVFSKTVFRESAAEIEKLPADGGREVAFVGRSNAGKSSTINALTGIGRLAFVSKQPGRTQLINLVEVTPGHRIVDLPGYGYAKVAKDIKREWGILLERYLQERQELAALVVIMDIRHPLTPLDIRLIEWIAPRGLPLHVVLSKADKLTRQQQAQVVREVTAALAPLAPLPVSVPPTVTSRFPLMTEVPKFKSPPLLLTVTFLALTTLNVPKLLPIGIVMSFAGPTLRVRL